MSIHDVDTDTGSGRRPASAAHSSVPAFTLLSHPELARVGERALVPALDSGQSVAVSRLEPAFAPPGTGPSRPLADAYVSRRPLVVERVGADGVSFDASGCPKRIEIDGVVVTGRREIPAIALERGVTIVLARRVALLLHRADPLAGADAAHEWDLAGASAAVTALRRQVVRLAGTSVPVLLRGETGTGKELVAQALHRLSPRQRRPYLAVNLAAVPPSLAAAELFGAGRGAYTGADRARPGLLERASGGTLFLDEIGEAPLELQALLLRALETGEIQPVGGEPPRKVDVRLLAATDADLEAAVADGRFRAPLLHRLEGYLLRVPPLRERRDDVPRLLLLFLAQEARALGARGALPWPSPEDVARLVAADWPGNVRQLRNVARRLAIGEPIPPLATSAADEPAGRGEVSDAALLAAFRRNDYRVQAAARELGLPRTTVYERLARLTGRRSPAALDRRDIEAALAAANGDLRGAARHLSVSVAALRRRLGQLGLSP